VLAAGTVAFMALIADVPTLRRQLIVSIWIALAVAILSGLAWLVWLKADRIWAYRDATDVLRIVYGPFVYFMAIAIGLTAVIHLYKIVERR
jgi:hypothetical protein